MRKMKCGSTKYCPMVVMLLRKHTDMTFTEMVEFTGYPASSVGNILNRRYPELKIARTRKEDIDLKQLAHEYRDLGMTSYELGPKYGVNPATVRKWMRSIGICIGKENAPTRSGANGKGAATLKDRCRQRIVAKLKDEGGTLELVEYGEKLTLRCKVCGHQFKKSKGGYQHRYTCPSCEEEEIRRMVDERERRKLEKAEQLEAAREWRMSVPRVCKECGDPFWSEYPSVAYCCDTCRRRANNRANEQRRQRRGKARGYRHRMRVTVTSSTYDRTVTLAAVYRKYGGRCCSCGRQTYRTKDYSPSQATLDHIVALANNGTHTWDNVQLLCSDCNSMKRDLGQMRLPMAI